MTMNARCRMLEIPVLVVGAGAGGLATSALLAKCGVGSLVVERRGEVFRYPKARNLSFRSLEILRALGVGEAVHAVAAASSDVVIMTALNSPEQRTALDVDAIFAGLDGLSPEPSVQYCPQSRLEPILLEHLRSRGSHAWYRTELQTVEPDADGVTAVVRDRDSAARTTIRARYLVAADGVHSRIRDTLGVTASGYGELPIYVVFVYFRGPWRALAPQLGRGAAVQIVNERVNGILVAAEDDLAMFITTYRPRRGESAGQFTVQRCRELIVAAAGEPIDVDIIEVTPWQPCERVADEFRCGRVFFVGDSAHAMPPFKAGGANVAIQSADNLAWKLAAVLHGWAGAPLLDTYHAERHPVGVLSARQSLTGPTVAFLNLDSDQDRPPAAAQSELPMFALLTGYRYASSAVVAEGCAPPAGAVNLVSELRGQPGTRIPHTWVVHRGRRVSTLDFVEPGFTLLACDGGARWAAAAAEAGLNITVHTITAGADLDGRWAERTALGPDGALLVRPDRFVAWRSETLPADPARSLRDVLAAVLGTAPTSPTP